jgi:hypothetical protein
MNRKPPPPADPRYPDARTEAGKPNWSWIETEYRRGIVPVREIASAAGYANRTTIDRRAQAQNWTRGEPSPDVTAQAQARARTDAAEIAKLIERAESTVNLTGAHRMSLTRCRRVLDHLMANLEQVVLARHQLRALCESGEIGREQGAAALRTALTINGHAEVARKIIVGLRWTIELERTVEGLDRIDKAEEKPADMVPLADRLRYYESIDDGHLGPNVVTFRPNAGGNPNTTATHGAPPAGRAALFPEDEEDEAG